MKTFNVTITEAISKQIFTGGYLLRFSITLLLGLAVFLLHLYFNQFKSKDVDGWIVGLVKSIEMKEAIRATVDSVATLRIEEVSPVIYSLQRS